MGAGWQRWWRTENERIDRAYAEERERRDREHRRHRLADSIGYSNALAPIPTAELLRAPTSLVQRFIASLLGRSR